MIMLNISRGEFAQKLVCWFIEVVQNSKVAKKSNFFQKSVDFKLLM